MNSSKTRSTGRGGSERALKLAQIITWFDSYVELYTIDPVRIEKALRNYEGTDIEQAWKSIRKDVDKINELPEESDDVARYAKKSSLARNLTFLLTAATFAFLLIFLYFQNELRAVLGTSAILIAPGVVIAMMYGALMYNTWTTRKFNGRMRAFYLEHRGELRKQTAHIKDTTQLLIDKLQREIYSQNLDPGKFKFELYHENYKGVLIVGKRRDRSVATIKPKS